LDNLILRIYKQKNINSGMILTGNARHVPFHRYLDLRPFAPTETMEMAEYISESWAEGDVEEQDDDEEDDQEENLARQLVSFRV